MAVLLETSLGNMVIDLYTDNRPNCCKNFLKLCKVKYYNFCLFHSVQRNLVAQTGDPTGTGKGGESIHLRLYGEQARYFDTEKTPIIKHTKSGLVSMVNNGHNGHGSQFFLTLGDNLDYLDGNHTVFGEVGEGDDILSQINEAYVDRDNRPYKDIRIYHTIILEDPFPDPEGLVIPDRSPEPSKEQLQTTRIGADEEIDDFKGKTEEEIKEYMEEKEAKASAQILTMVGDLPDEDVKPPENVLFVCKLNPVTSEEDLEVIFSRFGKINSCEVIKDEKSGESLQYAFIEFDKEEDCERAYFKMDNVLIDDRRIHVDFSQSVAKVKWNKKGKQMSSKDDDSFQSRYAIKDRARKDNYELVFEQSGKESKKKKKKTKEKSYSNSDDSDKESEIRQKKKNKDKRNTGSSPPQKTKHRYSEERSPISDRRKRNQSPERHRRKSRSPPTGSSPPQKTKHRYSEERSPISDRRKRNQSPERHRRKSRSPQTGSSPPQKTKHRYSEERSPISDRRKRNQSPERHRRKSRSPQHAPPHAVDTYIERKLRAADRFSCRGRNFFPEMSSESSPESHHRHARNFSPERFPHPRFRNRYSPERFSRPWNRNRGYSQDNRSNYRERSRSRDRSPKAKDFSERRVKPKRNSESPSPSHSPGRKNRSDISPSHHKKGSSRSYSQEELSSRKKQSAYTSEKSPHRKKRKHDSPEYTEERTVELRKKHKSKDKNKERLDYGSPHLSVSSSSKKKKKSNVSDDEDVIPHSKSKSELLEKSRDKSHTHMVKSSDLKFNRKEKHKTLPSSSKKRKKKASSSSFSSSSDSSSSSSSGSSSSSSSSDFSDDEKFKKIKLKKSMKKKRKDALLKKSKSKQMTKKTVSKDVSPESRKRVRKDSPNTYERRLATPLSFHDPLIEKQLKRTKKYSSKERNTFLPTSPEKSNDSRYKQKHFSPERVLHSRYKEHSHSPESHPSSHKKFKDFSPEKVKPDERHYSRDRSHKEKDYSSERKAREKQRGIEDDSPPFPNPEKYKGKRYHCPERSVTPLKKHRIIHDESPDRKRKKKHQSDSSEGESDDERYSKIKSSKSDFKKKSKETEKRYKEFTPPESISRKKKFKENDDQMSLSKNNNAKRYEDKYYRTNSPGKSSSSKVKRKERRRSMSPVPRNGRHRSPSIDSTSSSSSSSSSSDSSSSSGSSSSDSYSRVSRKKNVKRKPTKVK